MVRIVTDVPVTNINDSTTKTEKRECTLEENWSNLRMFRLCCFDQKEVQLACA